MPTVLIVDDDETLRDLVHEWLTFNGYTVICCGTGQEALDRLGMLRFDAILLDWELGDICGLDILKQYRAEGGGAPVLMLAGGTAVQKEQALAAGANSYIRKPFKLNEIADTLAQVLGTTGSKV